MITMNYKDGLISAIVQDAETGEVLMTAFMNEEAFRKTVETGQAHYYSRSRDALWLKGESSGNIQKVRDILVDCDEDAVLLKVEQKGGACHMGYRSCFYRKLEQDELVEVGEKIFDPDEVYGGQ